MNIIINRLQILSSAIFSRARALGARFLLRVVYNRYIISVSRIVVRVKEQETSACMIRR